MSREWQFGDVVPDRLIMEVKGISEWDTHILAMTGLELAKRFAPKLTGAGARNLSPLWGDGWFGIHWRNNYCLAPGNRVLTPNWRWVPVESLVVGDALVAPQEEKLNMWRRYETATVEYVGRGLRDCVEVEFDDGFTVVCTRDHPWLANAGSPRDRLTQRWVHAEDLIPGDQIGVYFEVWKEDHSWEAGWLAGILDGEGCLNTNDLSRTAATLSVAQKPGVILDQIESSLKERGFTLGYRPRSTSSVVFLEVLGGFGEQTRLLGSIRPIRLLSKLRYEGRPLRSIRKRTVVEVRSLGHQEVVFLSTSTKTYIVEGMGSHNTWFQENGISPFTMRSLAGKTIPLWVNDPTGEVAAQNPKAEQRVTVDGRRQTLIFRKAAPIGSRKTVVREGREVDVPRSYPGAPGRINRREPAATIRRGSRVGGRIAISNVGVRWRHPGLTRRSFLRNSLIMAAQHHGVTPGRIRDDRGRFR